MSEALTLHEEEGQSNSGLIEILEKPSVVSLPGQIVECITDHTLQILVQPL